MAITVILEDIAEKLDEVNNEWRIFLNTKTGEFVSVQQDHLGIAEDLDEDDDLSGYRDWEQEAIREAVCLLENWDDYAELPTQYDIHEYSIMEDFAYATKDTVKREKLCRALQGKGAFRRFKDTVIYTGLEETWYAYRFLAYVKIAREWCEDNGIPYKLREEL